MDLSQLQTLAPLIIKVVMGASIIGAIGYVVKQIIKYGEDRAERKYLELEIKARNEAEEASRKVKETQDNIPNLSDSDLDKLM